MRMTRYARGEQVLLSRRFTLSLAVVDALTPAVPPTGSRTTPVRRGSEGNQSLSEFVPP